MLAFLRTIPAYVFGNFRDKQMLFCILQNPLEIIQILKPKFSFFSKSTAVSRATTFARDWSGVTAKARETQDCVSPAILVPNVQYNLGQTNKSIVFWNKWHFQVPSFQSTYFEILFVWCDSTINEKTQYLQSLSKGCLLSFLKTATLILFFHLENRKRNNSYTSSLTFTYRS